MPLTACRRASPASTCTRHTDHHLPPSSSLDFMDIPCHSLVYPCSSCPTGVHINTDVTKPVLNHVNLCTNSTNNATVHVPLSLSSRPARIFTLITYKELRSFHSMTFQFDTSKKVSASHKYLGSITHSILLAHSSQPKLRIQNIGLTAYLPSPGVPSSSQIPNPYRDHQELHLWTP